MKGNNKRPFTPFYLRNLPIRKRIKDLAQVLHVKDQLHRSNYLMW